MEKLENWADEKDGIVETKGKLMRTVFKDKPVITKGTKINGMLKDIRSLVKNEIERKLAN